MQQTEQDRSGHSAARKRNGARAARSGDAAAEPIEMTVLSDEVEDRLKQGRMRLKPEEWKSGDNCWLIDVVAPPAIVKQVVQDVMKSALAGRAVKYYGRDAEAGKGNVFEGKDI